MSGKPRVALADYGSGGNIRSAFRGLEKAGADVEIVSSADQLGKFDGLVVPGQGSFGDCAANLSSSSLWNPIRDWIESDRPFFGICVGYQLLFESSEESGEIPGLGIFKGKVVRFPSSAGKIPHMGWNELEKVGGKGMFDRLEDRSRVYFVHSFHPIPEDESIVSAWCSYGDRFAAAVQQGNLRATQFHPEKSQAVGIRILQNFVESL